MKIVFMGTPDFAKKSLEAIYDEGYSIVGVVTNPDKPKGRGMKLQPNFAAHGFYALFDQI